MDARTFSEDFAVELATLPGVTQKRMFGCDGWSVDGRVFAFVAKDGLVVRTEGGSERDAALAEPGAVGFRMGKQPPARNWILIPLASGRDVERALPHGHTAYRIAAAAVGRMAPGPAGKGGKKSAAKRQRS